MLSNSLKNNKLPIMNGGSLTTFKLNSRLVNIEVVVNCLHLKFLSRIHLFRIRKQLNTK